MSKWTLGCMLAAAASTFACASEKPVSIGDDSAVTGESLKDYSAFWDGYVEGVTFPSGSDRVRLELDQNGEGYLEIGDIPALAPPTDPTADYPGDGLDLGVDPDTLLHEGFHYTVRNAAVEEKRIRLSVATRELYEDWCELQTSYANQDPGNGAPAYSCAPPSHSGFMYDGKCYIGTPAPPSLDSGAPSGFTPGPDSIEFNCLQAHYCSGSTDQQLCSCTADGCVAHDNVALTLDAALDKNGKELTGTLIWTDNSTVRLTRQ
jgi:hypothetical protein